VSEVDPRRNPYTPNAGARPPVLVGRDDQLETFELLLGRLADGYAEQSMIITGLRGVGKTVLLNEFRRRAEDVGWAVVEIEVSKHDDSAFRTIMAREVRRALFAIAPRAKWKATARRAAAALRSFSITLSADGGLSAGLDVEAIEGLADSGMLEADLTDLFVALGEAAREHETGVVFLLDEIQFLSVAQLESLIAALHRSVQRSLPITLVAAGLPQIPELAGEAKSYSERLFKFPAIGRLGDVDARRALEDPARAQGVGFTSEATDLIVDYTEGYPYFIQEFGKAVWDLADGPDITVEDARTAIAVVEEKLDSSFFRVRLDRTTDLECAYLRAMAELGSEAQSAGDVASLLDRTSQQCGPTRARLIDKGLLYTPTFGYAAFTVPKFDAFLKRTVPLTVPPKRPRNGRRT
jgi:hypothetical protein